MAKILLIEPKYKNKFPPLGLMKIASYHKAVGDEVTFYKGTSRALLSNDWNKVYIATLFTFHWKITLNTIQFYSPLLSKGTTIIVGGIMANLLRRDLKSTIDSRIVIKDLSDFPLPPKASKSFTPLNNGRPITFDDLPPDYDIFTEKELPYRQVIDSSYILSSTKGCSRGCNFCAVPKLSKSIITYKPIKYYLRYIARKFGERKNLLLLDDNFLLSPHYKKIIHEIKDCGFFRGAKLGKCKRFVDFNQGLDMRLLTKDHIKLLREIPLQPVRLAYDHLHLTSMFKEKINWLVDSGFTEISAYLLYNYKDKPADLYVRLENIVELNEKYGSRIYGFPMKYLPLDCRNRGYIGRQWSKRKLRGVQCILNATNGIAPRTKDFFNKAFGASLNEYQELLQMPENYIIYRKSHSKNGNISKLRELLSKLNYKERILFETAISNGKTRNLSLTNNPKVNQIISHYNDEYLT